MIPTPASEKLEPEQNLTIETPILVLRSRQSLPRLNYVPTFPPIGALAVASSGGEEVSDRGASQQYAMVCLASPASVLATRSSTEVFE